MSEHSEGRLPATPSTPGSDQVAQLRRALSTVRELRAKLEGVERARTEPIAIVGLGCRFPGNADSPESFWRLLIDRVDAISEVPAERWNVRQDGAGQSPLGGAMRWGGFLSGVDLFDAPFFGIAPREAARMDPQQRFLLEVAWEAVENAGQTMESLAGSRTGVFVGVHSHSSDYFWLQGLNPDAMDIYTGPGTAHNVISGRLSYLFDLRGPSLAVDTACSSSLLAVHLACQSLRAGECNMALAGGVNAILSPIFGLAASTMQMLAPDGRCKTFDARADGFVRGEGCGLVVLKRLSDAQASGDRILALIRGSAANQDGHTNGLTAPNGLSQQAVIRQALCSAGVAPGQVTYVETHGTGTPLGDPIEVEALATVLGGGDANARPCLLGSVKTNFGHLEGAAGIAGLIKTVLALQHATIPANLHYTSLNPHISLANTRLAIATQASAWPAGPERRYAGVSSFGWSGTNVHIVLEEAPVGPATPSEAAAERPYLLPLSARSPKALGQLARSYEAHLTAPASGNAQVLRDICYTAALRRTHHEHRLAVVGRSRAEMAERLAELGRAELGAAVVAEEGKAARGLVFVFPGQGSQWLGMGRELLASEPVFRQALVECEAALRPYVDWSLLGQLQAEAEESRLGEIDVVQPLLFAIQVGLAALWRSWGVEPEAVVGHSMGEVAAAYVAGALDLDEAARVICLRSRLLRRVSGKGAMAVVGLPLDQARELLAPYAGRLSVAVSNSPRSTVLSGEPAALEQVLVELRGRNVFCRAVKVDVAAHSPQVEPLCPELRAALAELRTRIPAVPLYSTVTGDRLAHAGTENGSALDANYWARNLRQPVLFATAVERLLRDDFGLFVELSPHPILLPAIEESLVQFDRKGHTLPSLVRNEYGQQRLLTSLGALYATGYAVDWQCLFPEGGCPVDLPPYPWQRKRYWLDAAPVAGNAAQQSQWLATATQARSISVAPQSSDSATIEDLLYEVQWQPQARVGDPIGQQPLAAGTWLVFAGEQGQGLEMANLLAERGVACAVALPGDEFRRLGDGRFTLDPTQAEQFPALLAQVFGGTPPAGSRIVHLWGLSAASADAPTSGRVQDLTCRSVLHLVQAIARAGWAEAPRLWLVTQGAQPAGERPVAAPIQAALWGLGRVIAMEHPEMWGGLVDMGPEAGASDLRRLFAEIADQSHGNDQVALRGTERYFARLVRSGQQEAQEEGVTLVRGDATYLVTGGLGGLGLKVAQWLVGRGARNLALMGRSEPKEQARLALRTLEDAGVRVAVLRCDVARETDLAAALSSLSEAMPPLRGIVHAAGVLDDGVLWQMEWARFARVLAPKIDGAWHLHALTRELPLDFFVLFSSATALLGTRSQGNHAAANAFLDGLAHYRRAQGLVATSVNWGAWAQVGAAVQAGREQRLSRGGIDGMAPAVGLAALERVLRQNRTQSTVMALAWERYAGQLPAGCRTAFLSAVLQSDEPSSSATSSAAPGDGIIQRLKSAAPGERYPLLSTYVSGEAARVMRFDADQPLEPQQGFFQMGMDSLTAMELKNRLQTNLGCPLPPTVAFDYPNVATLARYLLDMLMPTAAAASVEQGAAVPAASLKDIEGLSRGSLKALLDEELRLVGERVDE
ncbi:MAG: type I polyketide synthase [Chloroflexota bacterium]